MPDVFRSWKPKLVIDPHSVNDMRQWSKRFGVSENDLRAAIGEVGPRTATLATHFGCVVPD
jgi:uncharacterized protein DUF3606